MLPTRSSRNPNNCIYDLPGNLAEWTLTNLFGEGVSGGHFETAEPNRLECGYRQEINPGQLRDESVFDAVRPSNRVALDSFLQWYLQITLVDVDAPLTPALKDAFFGGR